MLGDMFDFWFEYKDVVPRGFTRFLGKISELTDNGVEVHYFTGNHDMWMDNYLEEECGVILHRGPLPCEINGKEFYLAHGDGLGDDSKMLKLMTGFFHNRTCQWLFKLIHPDLTTKFAHWWSKKSRLSGDDFPEFMGENQEHLVLFAKNKLKEVETKNENMDFFIFGHRHIELDLMLTRSSRMFILGDWINHFSYAVMDENGRMWMDNFETPADVEDVEVRDGVSIAF